MAGDHAGAGRTNRTDASRTTFNVAADWYQRDPFVELHDDAWAQVVYFRFAALSKTRLTDGMLSRRLVAMSLGFGCPDLDASLDRLVAVGLLESNGDDVLCIPREEWERWQTTNDEIEAKRARWRGQKAGKPPAESESGFREDSARIPRGIRASDSDSDSDSDPLTDPDPDRLARAAAAASSDAAAVEGVEVGQSFGGVTGSHGVTDRDVETVVRQAVDEVARRTLDEAARSGKLKATSEKARASYLASTSRNMLDKHGPELRAAAARVMQRGLDRDATASELVSLLVDINRAPLAAVLPMTGAKPRAGWCSCPAPGHATTEDQCPTHPDPVSRESTLQTRLAGVLSDLRGGADADAS